jgi:hypothetical protein
VTEEPVDENKLIADSARAARAKALLEDELLTEAFNLYEAELMAAWRATGTALAETHKRERLWLAVNLLGKVREHLFKVVQNGKVAKAHLAQIEGKRQHAA